MAESINTNKNNNIWLCFLYMFKIKQIWLLFILLILLSFVGKIGNLYEMFDTIPDYLVFCMAILQIIGYPLVIGYIVSVIETISNADGINIVLPKFSIKQSFFDFIKVAVAFLIGIVTLSIGTLIPIIIAALMYNSHDGLIKFLGLIVGLIIVAIYLCFFALLPAFILYFVKTKQILSFLQYPRIFNLISNNEKLYLNVIGAMLVLNIIAITISHFIVIPYKTIIVNELGKSVPVVNSLIPLFIIAVIGAYVTIAEIYIYAKCLKDKILE